MSPAENSTNGTGQANTGLIAYFAGNPVAVNLLLVLFFVGGIISGLQLAVQYFPDIEARQVNVIAEYPGASPAEVEADINRRIEEAVVGLAGVERVVGKATEGRGHLAVHVADFSDPDDVLERVQSAIIGIERFPPAGAERPEVELWQPAPEVMSLVVTSSEHGENRLRIVAEALRDELLELPSVSQVTLRGTRAREISIELSEEELRRNDLSIAALTGAVRSESLNLTMGEIRTQSGGVVLHIVAKREIGKEFENIPLITKLDGTIVRLGDVAVVRDSFADEDLASLINEEGAIFVHIDATEEQSVVAIADEVRALLANFATPDGFAVQIWKDSASPVVDRLLNLVNSGILGAILVFICLLLVFDLRVAWWISVGIPLSFIGALLFFGPADQSLNIGTLFGFFLLIGIVVDDAVVVGESIAAERERGLRGLDAAVSGAQAVVGPGHDRRLDDNSGLHSVLFHHGTHLSDRQRFPVHRHGRAACFAPRIVLHTSGTPVEGQTMEPVAVERHPASNARPTRRLARQRRGAGGRTCSAQSVDDANNRRSGLCRIDRLAADRDGPGHLFRQHVHPNRRHRSRSADAGRHAIRGNAGPRTGLRGRRSRDQ